MRLAIASDLHLEFAELSLKNTTAADVLILAGDILVANDLYDHKKIDIDYPVETLSLLGSRQLNAYKFRKFISEVSSEFKHVIVIAGNHEFYNGRWVAAIDTLREEYGKYSNIYFLENDSKSIEDVTFVGATLWTDMNKGDPITLHAISNIMNDFSLIRNDSLGFTKLRPAHVLSRFRQSIDYFNEIVSEKKDSKVVIISHMAPSSLSIHEMYKGDYVGNGAYYSDLSEFILDNDNIKLWCHGHMHHHVDYYIGTTRVVSNPRGYVGIERKSESEDPYIIKTIDL